MGTWGTALYSNDTTLDVKETYMKYLEDQLTNQEAYEKILATFDELMGDTDEEPLFWYALADTQWKVGRLTEEVRQKALEWIAKEGGITLWEESKTGPAGWRKTLDKLKIKLETEQPKEKRIKKPTAIFQNFWNTGDVYAYQFNTDTAKENGAYDKYMILQKIGEEPHNWKEGIVMRVHVFDKLFDAVPSLNDLEGVRLLPLDYPYTTPFLGMSYKIELCKKREYPIEHLTFLGSMNIPPNKGRRNNLSSLEHWSEIEHWSKFFKLWQGIKYEEVEEGIFKYNHPEQPNE